MPITPSVGRIVWFYRRSDAHDYIALHRHAPNAPVQPCAAIIAHVIDDEHVTLTVLDHDGRAHGVPNVWLRADDTVPLPDELDCFASWMPYQLGQAAKTAQAEAKATPQASANSGINPNVGTGGQSANDGGGQQSTGGKQSATGGQTDQPSQK
jgi:hypothetical protein